MAHLKILYGFRSADFHDPDCCPLSVLTVTVSITVTVAVTVTVTAAYCHYHCRLLLMSLIVTHCRLLSLSRIVTVTVAYCHYHCHCYCHCHSLSPIVTITHCRCRLLSLWLSLSLSLTVTITHCHCHSLSLSLFTLRQKSLSLDQFSCRTSQPNVLHSDVLHSWHYVTDGRAGRQAFKIFWPAIQLLGFQESFAISNWSLLRTISRTYRQTHTVVIQTATCSDVTLRVTARWHLGTAMLQYSLYPAVCCCRYAWL